MAFLQDQVFVVALGGVIFLAVLVYFGVPKLIGAKLDSRADQIRDDLEQSRKLREEAQEIAASFERKLKETEEDAKKIVETARINAEKASKDAQEKLKIQVDRRIQSAKDEIARAEAEVQSEITTKATEIATKAASTVIEKFLTSADKDASINTAIDEIKSAIN